MINIECKKWKDYITYLLLRDKATQLRLSGEVLNHPYFVNHPSCQNRRYMDRESQYYIINRLNYSGNFPIADAVINLIFRKDSTYQAIKEHFGDCPGNVVIKEFKTVSNYILQNVDIPFTGAYLVPHRDNQFNNKVEGWLSLFSFINFETISTITTAKDAYKFFKNITGFGDFLAMQFVAELGWLDNTLYGGNEFVIPGNGAVRGLLKLGIPKSHHVKFLHKLVKDQPLANNIFKPMVLMDYQNTFCEFDKFTRYLGGYDNQGRERMKRLRKPYPIPITEFKVTNKLNSDSYYKIN
jgi:hypothetical protein